jgi:hypothetical protein
MSRETAMHARTTLLLSLAATLPALTAHAAERPPRVAVVVGANQAAPGRKALLYGHRDAEKMIDVLLSVGGFRPDEVYLLKDSTPATVLKYVEQAVARLAGKPHALLYFYYSGHADEDALYPGGQPLPLAALRARIDDAQVSVKIGVVDACRGGGWTRAKGLSPAEPFEVNWPVNLDSEGSVLIASSSGRESAHESDELQGSFFTFHFAAGLRGAADANGNNEITLTEAFEYARQHTIRDTVRLTSETQHPSYAVNLRGRSDLVLANIDASPSIVEIRERAGPLQLIHVESGIKLLELEPGARNIRIAVPPGRYLVRKPAPGGNLVREISVFAGTKNAIDEAQLTLVGTSRLAVKAPMPILVESPVTREPPSRTPVAVKTGAIAGASLALAGIALGLKFGLDRGSINGDLDEYRRFPCSQPPDNLCDSRGEAARALNKAQVDAVHAKKDDAAGIKSMEIGAYVGAGIAATVSAILFYQWYRSSRDEPSQAFTVSPLLAGPTLAPGVSFTLLR